MRSDLPLTRRGAALAGSMLLNLLLLAGVVAAMRGPDAPAPGARSALVTISITPAPRKTAPPPPVSEPEARQAAIPAPPMPEPRPAPVLPEAPGLAPVSTPPQTAQPPEAEPVPSSPPPPVLLSAPRQNDPPSSRIAAYRQQVWQRILAARPRGARGAGTVTVRFRIGRSGALVSADVSISSGQFMLDRMALQAVRKAAPFPAPPAGMDDAALTFTVPVAFHK
ncbi:energy transducer TonB family protein [Novosphingobium beihaiensis]|uniref:TonB family protein n=1 Tax=Novosphingobium beihaiensis TaxID=2930389 RepID=A0ABT0BLT3_9SPHN|nr:energy transducer TonB [Novosphingobium beihaiensis]MCJ2185994.1 TonB family protein [Novosphingobium beihaiensis]